VDFSKIFLPIMKMSSINVLLSLATGLDLEIEHIDVKIAFLHGNLEVEIYMELPKRFWVKRNEDNSYRLKKSLYSLKHAPK
jgi:hypothetical protein